MLPLRARLGELTPGRRTALLVCLAVVPFFLARLLLLLAYRTDFAGLSLGSISWAFIEGLRFDFAAILPFLALGLAMLNLPVRAANHSRWILTWGWLAFAMSAPAVFVLAADLVYFHEVHRHLSREPVLILHDPSFVGSMLLYHWHILFPVLGALCLLAVAWRCVLSAPAKVGKHPLLSLAILSSLVALGIRGSLSRKPLNPVDAYRDQSFALGNLRLNGLYTSLRASLTPDHGARNATTSEEAFATLRLDPSREYPLSRPVANPRAAGQNLIVILLESWDTRYMGCYGAKPSYTPCMDKIAELGLIFDAAYASSQRTIGGIQAVLTGVPTLPGVPELGHGLEHSNTTRIAVEARRAGYSTLFLQAPRRRSYYLDSIMGSLGFQHVYGKEDYPLVRSYEDSAKWGWDHDALQFGLEKLKELPEPFFSVFLTGTTHSPYAYPGSQFQVSEHSPTALGGYLNTLAYSDWALGKFFEGARAEPWFRRTTFVLLADHSFRGAPGDLRGLFHIPLVIRGPGLPAQRVQRVHSQLDCLPTFMELLGLRGPQSAIGGSLFQAGQAVALVKLGSVMGAIADWGYLTHSLQVRLESHADGPRADAEFNSLERYLLSTHRMTLDLIRQNRWAPRR